MVELIWVPFSSFSGLQREALMSTCFDIYGTSFPHSSPPLQACHAVTYALIWVQQLRGTPWPGDFPSEPLWCIFTNLYLERIPRPRLVAQWLERYSWIGRDRASTSWWAHFFFLRNRNFVGIVHHGIGRVRLAARLLVFLYMVCSVCAFRFISASWWMKGVPWTPREVAL